MPHGKGWRRHIQDKVLHVDVTRWTPGQDLLRSEAAHVVHGLCRLGVGNVGFASAHEGNATATAGATEDFVVDAETLQDVEHREAISGVRRMLQPK